MGLLCWRRFVFDSRRLVRTCLQKLLGAYSELTVSPYTPQAEALTQVRFKCTGTKGIVPDDMNENEAVIVLKKTEAKTLRFGTRGDKLFEYRAGRSPLRTRSVATHCL